MQDTSSIGGSIIACAVVCWVICGVVVCVRFYTRGKLSLILGREDWCVLVAWVSYIPSITGDVMLPACHLMSFKQNYGLI
jgi:hypothetical protein